MTPIPVEPIHFGDKARALAGWFHPVSAAARLGVVVCNPFGYEAVCAHRSLRHVATAAAAAGIPALRFDYDGTGDSAGGDLDPARLTAWVASVHQAIDVLKSRATVAQVALFGLRLGVMIGACAAIEREDIAGLIAFAPMITGKFYLRELKMRQGTLGLGAPPAHVATDSSIRDAIGFPITEATRLALQAADLTKQERMPARNVLVLDRDDLPTADQWIARLTALGARVDARRVSGYVAMVLDAHKAVVPEAAIAASIAWLEALPVGGPTAGAPPPPMPSEGVGQAANDLWSGERHVNAGGLAGIATVPERPSGRAIVMLSAGAVHHIGPNRLYTTLARRWAARGHLCLRVDLTGIGDTPPRAGAPENVVYGPHALDDVHEAIAWLRRQPGITDVRALGLCSGAYHAFKAAVAGEPLDGIVVINPLTFFWKEGQALDFPPSKVADEAARYSRSMWERDKWKKLFQGNVQLRHVWQMMSRHAASAIVNRMRDLSRRCGYPWADRPRPRTRGGRPPVASICGSSLPPGIRAFICSRARAARWSQPFNAPAR